DDKITELVDRHRIAWTQDGCRGVFLDQRRAGDAIAGTQLRSQIDLGGYEAASEEHGLLSAHGALRWDGLARRYRKLRRLRHDPGYGRAQADELRRLLRSRGAVAHF